MKNSKQPLLSLIIPDYNTEEYVQKCLDSIYEQTYKNIEIIIVNNGSSGNINDIVHNYRLLHPERVLKLVIQEKNIGTFHGRGSGMDVAEGDYFTFMDADDRIGVDYFYQMIHHAEKTNSEIVVTDLVHEDENKYAFRYVIDPVRSLNFEIEGRKEIFDFYYSFAGRSYSMYGIWNKIYKRSLWDRSKPFIDAITEQFALCEDAEYTTIFFSQAEKISNIHNQYYYHYVHSASASAGLASSYEKAERSIRFQGTAFRNMKEHLKRAGVYDQHRENFEIFRGFHQKCMLHHIDNSELKTGDKAYLTKYCNKEFENASPEPLTRLDMFFTQHFVTQTNELEAIREHIISDTCKVVSFDVFDTAIIRAAWQPIDVFGFMTPKFKELTGKEYSFARARISAEQYAREICIQPGNFREDITLDEIYKSLCELYHLDVETADQLKELEIETEMQFCSARRITKELYDLAIRSGKIVIFASDIYLPREVLKEVLQKNGFTQYSKLYVSSEMGVTKASGNMFQEIMSDFKDYSPKQFFHIGDTYDVDVVMAQTAKWKVAYLPKTIDVFCNFSKGTYAGHLYENLYSNFSASKLSADLGLRTAIAVAANLIFDNPFVLYHGDSDFNGDPYHMGVLPLGMYLYGFCQWLAEQIEENGHRRIAFVGEEMELFYRAFDAVCKREQKNIQIEYRTIRNEKISLPKLRTREELKAIPTMIDIKLITPIELCNALEYCLDDDFAADKSNILKSSGIVPNKKFETYAQIKVVLDLLCDEYFSEEKVKSAQRSLDDAEAYVISGLNLTANAECQNLSENKHLYTLYKPMIFNWEKITAFCAESSDFCFRAILFAFLRDPEQENIGTKSVLQVIRKGVFDFIQNFSEVHRIFDLNWSGYAQLTEPMDYLIHQAKYLDQYIFAVAEIEEDSFVGDLWAHYVKPTQAIAVIGDTIDYSRLNKFQKLCCMILADHDRLKEAVKRRLKRYPHLFYMVKGLYKSVKK